MTTTPMSTTNAAAPAPTTPTIIYSNTARFPHRFVMAPIPEQSTAAPCSPTHNRAHGASPFNLPCQAKA
jgi:hypothetical protein